MPANSRLRNRDRDQEKNQSLDSVEENGEEPIECQQSSYRRRQERERYHTTSIDYNTLNKMASTTHTPNATTNSSTSTSSGKLAQEIHDEFLSCKMCLEGFKNPKCLDCLHTFCEQCIENHVTSECTYKKYSDYREFTCPLCRKRTQLPVGGVKKLPDNFLVSSLSELVARQRPSKFPFCDICKLVNRKHREASSKCLDCNKLLCKQCVELHKETKVTKTHSLFELEIEKDVECKEHEEEVIRFYCEKCEKCICVLCTFNEHKDHEITQFSDAVVKYKENIEDLLGSCKNKIEQYDSQLGMLSKCDVLIKGAEQSIRDSAIQFIAEVRTKEKQLIDDLHQIYGPELMEYVSKRGEMQTNLDSLKSTCNLTEIVLKGKDIELLLLKKEVQEKLSCLAEVKVKDLPNAVERKISFIPGWVEFGALDDLDNPTVPNRLRQQRSVNGLFRDPRFMSSNAASQTDLKELNPTSDSGIQTDSADEEKSNHSNVDGSAGTEVIETLEKGVNTRSRSLQSLTHQLQRTGSDADTNNESIDNVFPDQTSPPPRRHRRRRERPRIEVGCRPTTNYVTPSSPASNVSTATVTILPPSRAGPILSYGSSIDESYYSPDGGGGAGGSNGYKPSP